MPLSQCQLAEMAKEAIIDGKVPRPVVCLAKVRRTLRTHIVTVSYLDPKTGMYQKTDYEISEYLDAPPCRWRRQSTFNVDFGTLKSVVITATDFSLM